MQDSERTYGIEVWGCASKSNINHPKITVKNPKDVNRRALVCYKSNPPSRLEHKIC
jgi:hypothetical protein